MVIKRNYLRIRTKNPSAEPLKKTIIVPRGKRALFRLGSRTPVEEVFTRESIRNNQIIEINTIEACATSANKELMKRCFNRFGVSTADWYKIKFVNNDYVVYDGQFGDQQNDKEYNINNDIIKYPVVAKSKGGAQGRGNYKLDDANKLKEWLDQHRGTLSNYIFEKFYNFSKEYRLHVTKDGCFYTCRKMLKRDCPEELRWQRHDDNSVWIVEENEMFAKPKNWNEIEEHCVKALQSVGLDTGACDVKCQTNMNENVKFIILEINSAPSMGDRTIVEYTKILQKIVNE